MDSTHAMNDDVSNSNKSLFLIFRPVPINWRNGMTDDGGLKRMKISFYLLFSLLPVGGLVNRMMSLEADRIL